MEGLPFYVLLYNRRKKPWRRLNWFAAPGEKKRRGFKLGLCILIGLEFLFLMHTNEDMVRSIRQKLLDVSHHTEVTVEPGADGFRGGNTYPAGQKERGISIEWEDGILRFWKTDQTVRPVE